MSSVNIRQIQNKTLLGFAIAAVLVTIGFIPELLHTELFGINISLYYLCGWAIVFFLVTLYFKHMERAQLIAYNHGSYMGLTEALGFFGYSVASPAVLKRRSRGCNPYSS